MASTSQLSVRSFQFDAGERVAYRLQELLQVAYVNGVGITGFLITAQDRDSLSAYVYTCANEGREWNEAYRVGNWTGIPIEVYGEEVEDGDGSE